MPSDLGEFILMSTVQNMKEIGKMTFKMDMERNPGKMDRSMKDIIKKAKNMERENISGQMDLFILGIGLIIK